MSDNIDRMENQQDEDKDRKRPVLFIPLVILGLLLLAGATYAVASTIASPEPTQEPTEAATPTEEATEVVTEEPTVSTEVPTEEPTVEVTEEPTDEPTEPTDEAPTPTTEPIPTREPRPQPTVEQTVEATLEVTQPPVADSTCGSACDANGNCTGDYACFNGVCWNASICEPPATREPGGGDNVTCKCEDQFEVCSDGSSKVTLACARDNCEFDSETTCFGDRNYSTEAQQNCTAFYWCGEGSEAIPVSCRQRDNLCGNGNDNN
jgi:hypothetical protein